MSASIFGINRPTLNGGVQGNTEHITVTIDNGRVVLTPAAAPDALDWNEEEYARFMQEQAKEGGK